MPLALSRRLRAVLARGPHNERVTVHTSGDTGAERGRSPNIRDVARLAGVSYQTVSRVLNHSPSIRDTTRDRVLAVIGEIGYRPNAAARALVTSRSRTLGVLSLQTALYGPTTALYAIEAAAREAGYRISMTTISTADVASITAAVDHLTAQPVEAIIVIAPQTRVLAALEELPISVPVVTLQALTRSGRRQVSADQQSAGRAATRHLIELGHTEILHLAGPQDWIEAEARMQGYLDELIAADLRVRAPVLGDWTAAFGYYAGLELLRFCDFSAVFAANDQMALGFLHACREVGLSVPGDLSVIGFDDTPESAHYAPALTTVRQDFTEIGRRAVRTVLASLDPDRADAAPAGSLRLELVVRASTAPPSTQS